MKAVVCENTELTVQDVPDPEPGPGEVVVEMKASGMCGSDLHQYRRKKGGGPAATGLPVVAGDSGGAPDAVLDGETGWVVRGGSPAAPAETAERIVALLGDAELRRRMGERGRAWVEERWRWDLLAERRESLL